MNSFMLGDSWEYPGSKDILRTISNGSPHDADDLKAIEELKLRTETGLEGLSAADFLAEEGVHCTVNAQMSKFGSVTAAPSFHITADSAEQGQLAAAPVSLGQVSFEPQDAELGAFDARSHKSLLAALGVSLADDLDSTKSANSEFHNSPDSPSQLSFPVTPHSAAFLADSQPAPHPPAQNGNDSLFPAELNPMHTTFHGLPMDADAAASLPPLIVPSSYSSATDFLGGLSPLSQMRHELSSRSHSQPIPLERAWEVTRLLESCSNPHIPSFLSQDLPMPIAKSQPGGKYTSSGRLSRAPSSASSFPQLSHAHSHSSYPAASHSFPRSSTFTGTSANVRSPARLPTKRTRSPQPDSSPSSRADRLGAARKHTPEISATDTDDSTSGDAPHKRRKGSKRMSCRQCGTHNTPQWRMGPDGPRTLCNACGVRFTKIRKHGGDAADAFPA